MYSTLCRTMFQSSRDSSIARPVSFANSFAPSMHFYVSPLIDTVEGRHEDEIAASGVFGSYRREMGWKNAKPRGTANDLSYRIFESGLITP